MKEFSTALTLCLLFFPKVYGADYTNCTTNANCTNGLGCYERSPEHIFPGTLSEEQLFAQEDENEAAVDKLVVEPFKNETSCYTNAQCESSFCQKVPPATQGLCQQPSRICRLAEQGETLPDAMAPCIQGLVSNTQNKCDIPLSDQIPQSYGLPTQAISPMDNQCNYELAPETKAKSIKALMTLRGMEWLLSTISLREDQDCLKVIPYLRDQIGKSFLESRKIILKNFNIEYIKLEEDFATLMKAKAKADALAKADFATREAAKLLPPVRVRMHGIQIDDKELASRVTSGYDGLYLMWRRNLLFQSLETAMDTLVTNTYQKVTVLNKSIAEWKDNDKTWKIGTSQISFFTCRSSGIFGLFAKKKIKQRWSHYYKVNGIADKNKSVINKEYLSKYLSSLDGSDSTTAAAAFTRPSYFLVDPLMHGDQGRFTNTNPGRKKTLGRNENENGNGNENFTTLHSSFKLRIIEFYKDLKPNGAAPNFIYEPELVAIEAPALPSIAAPELVSTPNRDCLQNPSNPKCAGFNQFIDNLADVGFAQFVAYSAHNRRDYVQFFPKSSTWRRKLLTAYEVDMQNVTKYYQELSLHRNKQNACIERIINGIVESGILLPPPGGVVPGRLPPVRPGPRTQGTTARAVPNRTTPVPGLRLTEAQRELFRFNLASNTNSVRGQGTFNGSLGQGASIGSGGIGDASSTNAMASRLEDLKKSNARAKASGINVEDKEKAVNKAAAFMASRSGVASPSSMSPNTLSFSKHNNSSNIHLSEDKKDEDPKPSTGSGQGQASIDLSSQKASNAEESAATAFKESSKVDPTGMSEEEKENMLANFERTQNDYKVTEDDGLFKILSKAYVRNLEKVLTKKKRITDD